MNLFRKEIEELSGRPRSYFVRLLFLIALLGCALLLWNQPGFAESSLSERTRFGRDLYFAFSVCGVALALLVLPSLAMNAIASEREVGMLDVLLVSPLSDTSIVTQKTVARLLLLVLFLCTATPFALLCTFLGGVSSYDLGFAVVRCVAMAAFASAVALYVSLVESNRGICWLVVALCLVVTPIGIILLSRRVALTGAMLVALLVSLAPGGAWVTFPVWSLWSGFLDPRAVPARDLIAAFVCVGAACFLVSSVASRLRVAAAPRDKSARRGERFRYGRGAVGKRRRVLQRLARGESAGAEEPVRKITVPPLSALRRSISRFFANPLLDRGLREKPSSVEEYGLALAVLAVPLCYLLGGAQLFLKQGLPGDDTPAMAIRVFLMLWLLSGGFLALQRGIGQLPRARESGMLTALQISPLTAPTIVCGWLLEGLWTLRYVWFPGLAVSPLLALVRKDPPLLLAPVALTLGSVIGLHALGQFLSLFLRAERTAQALALSLIFVPMMAHPVIERALPEMVAQVLRTANPFYVLLYRSSATSLLCGLCWLTLGGIFIAISTVLFHRSTGRLMGHRWDQRALRWARRRSTTVAAESIAP